MSPDTGLLVRVQKGPGSWQIWEPKVSSAGGTRRGWQGRWQTNGDPSKSLLWHQFLRGALCSRDLCPSCGLSPSVSSLFTQEVLLEAGLCSGRGISEKRRWVWPLMQVGSGAPPLPPSLTVTQIECSSSCLCSGSQRPHRELKG